MDSGALNGDPAGARTQDPLIKSQMLYQLSYRTQKKHSKYKPFKWWSGWGSNPGPFD